MSYISIHLNCSHVAMYVYVYVCMYVYLYVCAMYVYHMYMLINSVYAMAVAWPLPAGFDCCI